MSQRKMITTDPLAVLRQEITSRTQIVRLITALQEEIAYDRICGAWLSTENNLSVVIRRIAKMTYRMLLFDNALCYRRLVQDTVIRSEQHTLLFGSMDDPRDVHVVEYDAENEHLRLGCYGRFIPEDTVSRQSNDSTAIEECPFNETEE